VGSTDIAREKFKKVNVFSNSKLHDLTCVESSNFFSFKIILLTRFSADLSISLKAIIEPFILANSNY